MGEGVLASQMELVTDPRRGWGRRRRKRRGSKKKRGEDVEEEKEERRDSRRRMRKPQGNVFLGIEGWDIGIGQSRDRAVL